MKRRAFTLIELLVVIAIIGLLATVAVIALGSARLKSRDTKRVADARQIGAALEQHFTEKAYYPTTVVAGGLVLGGAGATAICNNGFTGACTGTVFMGLVPKDPTSSGIYNYTYTACVASGACAASDCLGAATNCGWFNVDFNLEGPVASLAVGNHDGTPNGIK